MLAGGTAIAVEHRRGRVQTARGGQTVHGLGHCFIRQRQGAARQLFDAQARLAVGSHPLGKALQRGLRGGTVQRRIGIRSENARQGFGQQLTKDQVGIADRCRPAAPVAGRTWIGACRGRPHDQLAIAIVDDRSAAGGDRMHFQHRQAQSQARHLAPIARRVPIANDTDIGAGTAHVKANQCAASAALGGIPRQLEAGGHATGWARQHRRCAAESPRRHQHTVTAHQ